MVFRFGNPILLRGFNTCKFMDDVLFNEKTRKVIIDIFFSIVITDSSNSSSKLTLYDIVKLSKQLGYLIFIFHQELPSYPSRIIDKRY